MSKSRAISLDPGTFFFHVAEKMEDGKLNIKIIRNCFIELPDNEATEQALSQNNWQYVKDGKSYFVFGSDSLTVSRMFPHIELRRPMQHGVLNKGEDKKMKVLAKIIEDSVGRAPDENSLCCFCVSSESIDGSVDSVFHQSRMEGMIRRLGWKTRIEEEGLAVILSEKPYYIDRKGEKFPFSGIGISFGAGRVNCVLGYKGLKVIGMSAARSGDWVDQQVAQNTDATLSTVIYKKENELDFENLNYDDDVIFGLDAYYSNMIKFVFSNFAKKFKTIKSQFDAPIPIVIAGGTSLPNGFCSKVESVVSELELPFEISTISHASDPRNSIAKGLLAQAIISQKKLAKSNKNNKENKKDDMDELLD